MKNFQLLLVTMFTALLSWQANAQEISVVYSARINTASEELFKETGLPEDMRRALINAYGKVVFSYGLTYVNNESTFQMLPSNKKQEISFMGQTMDLSAMTEEQSKNVTYKNHQTKQIISKTLFLGKEFLVTDTIAVEQFNIVENEVKEILGFECKKAISIDGKKIIWFTEHIPVADGPINTNLPGLILEAHLDQYIYTATSIDDNTKQSIVVPTGGKKMTNAEFQEMVQKQTEMMKRGTGVL
jgi:GLPGLI family protein